MKTSLLFFLLFCSINTFSQTWSPPGATWHYTFFNPFGNSGYTQITYTGDTIINSQNAKKLEKIQHTYNFWTNQFQTITLGYEYTFEDNGVVYLWYNNNWDTLYNFNASIGDSWRMAKQPYILICDSNSTLLVTDTGTVFINNIFLKYIVVDINYGDWFQWIFTDTIVEKIGFLSYYMLPYDYCNGFLDVNEGGAFRCYSDNNFPLYQPFFTQNCDFIVGIEDEIIKDHLVIYPNPVKSVLNIERLPDPGKYSYKIYSTDGRLVQSGKLTETTDVSELSSGVYFIKLFDNSASAFFKFVKQ